MYQQEMNNDIQLQSQLDINFDSITIKDLTYSDISQINNKSKLSTILNNPINTINGLNNNNINRLNNSRYSRYGMNDQSSMLNKTEGGQVIYSKQMIHDGKLLYEKSLVYDGSVVHENSYIQNQYDNQSQIKVATSNLPVGIDSYQNQQAIQNHLKQTTDHRHHNKPNKKKARVFYQPDQKVSQNNKQFEQEFKYNKSDNDQKYQQTKGQISILKQSQNLMNYQNTDGRVINQPLQNSCYIAHNQSSMLNQSILNNQSFQHNASNLAKQPVYQNSFINVSTILNQNSQIVSTKPSVYLRKQYNPLLKQGNQQIYESLIINHQNDQNQSDLKQNDQQMVQNNVLYNSQYLKNLDISQIQYSQSQRKSRVQYMDSSLNVRQFNQLDQTLQHVKNIIHIDYQYLTKQQIDQPTDKQINKYYLGTQPYKRKPPKVDFQRVKMI